MLLNRSPVRDDLIFSLFQLLVVVRKLPLDLALFLASPLDLSPTIVV